MASLSEKLRRERELRGISLKQIADDTKIGVRFLEALEEGDVERIPGEFYRRSYLRAYARYLGLDEERAVNAYAYVHQDGEDAPAEPAAETPIEVPPWMKWAVLAVLIVVVLLVWFAGSDSPEGVESPPAAASVVTPQVPAASSQPPVSAEAPPQSRVPNPFPVTTSGAGEAGALQLELMVTEECWLEIQADGEIVTSGLKSEGFRQAVSADVEVRLWLGNAGGVSMTLNGQPARALGRPGQVRKDLAITPENFQDFVALAGRPRELSRSGPRADDLYESPASSLWDLH